MLGMCPPLDLVMQEYCAIAISLFVFPFTAVRRASLNVDTAPTDNISTKYTTEM